MGRLHDAIGLLDRLIRFPTVSSDGNLEMIATLAQHLEDAGARTEVMLNEDGRKANLFATLGPCDVDGGIVLSGHTDVVPADAADWASDPFVLRSDGQRLFGRGACDMKGFIACAVAMAPDLAVAARQRPIYFAFTYDEEVGCFGARALCETLATRENRPALAIIGEPTGMQVIDGHKGCCEYTTRFDGLSGHGSDPSRGVNAVEYAARYVGRLMALRERLKARAPDPPRFDPPFTTINVGGIHGGTGHNVIAGHARVDWEMRPVQPGDAAFVQTDLETWCRDELLPEMRAIHAAAAIETEIVGEVAGLVPTDPNPARDLAQALTGCNGAATVAFGTEAGLFQALGLAAVVCGPGSIAQAHKPDEFVEIAQLDRCLTMLGRITETGAR